MKKFKIGLQLYGVRDKMEKDMDATLKAVKEMGYECVEFAGYFDKTPDEIKAMLEKYGLEAVSVHREPKFYLEDNAKTEFDYLKAIGAKYCAIPWYKADEYFNNWDATIDTFTTVAKKMKENGIQLMYHNHDFEFKKIDGEYILDKLYSTIDKDLLMPEIDTCWVHYAGENPSEYLKKYKGRIDIVHLKDFVCEKLGGGPVYALIGNDSKEKSKDDNGFKYVPVGSGLQDVKSILDAADESGTKIIIVEQDMSYDQDSLDAAKQSREYLKTLGL